MKDGYGYRRNTERKEGKEKMEELEVIKRKTVQIFSEEELERKMKSGKKLTIKLGADPSRPDLHIGHSVALRVLRQFQKMGHEVVFVVGDFTGMIGDPSGKNKTRPALTFEQTRKSAQTYFEQATKILDKEKTKIVFNSEWLSRLTFGDVIDLASHYTVARMMERDDFKNRFEHNLPLSMHELLYPLMQGYDSVHLKADIEIGGTDQTFNLLVGRELQKQYGQEPQVVMTFPLLVGLDGKEKMSKSLDNYIGLSDTPFAKYEKSMKVPDKVLRQYLELATDLEQEEIEKIMKGDIRKAHEQLAKELITMYDRPGDFEEAKRRYEQIAKGQIPDYMPKITLQEASYTLCELVVKAGFAPSKSEAKRIIAGNGIKINGELQKDSLKEIDIEEELVIQFGKNRFIKIKKEELV